MWYNQLLEDFIDTDID